MEDSRRAFAKALSYLACRDHSTFDIRRKLTQKGFSAESIDYAISRLLELSYVDDERYARQLADSTIRNGKGYGCKIRYELHRRGIAADLIDAVMADATEQHDEEAIIASIVTRRFPDFEFRSADPREKRRVVGFLQRRGFSLSKILRALPDTCTDED